MPFTLNSALSQATRYGTRWSKLFSKQYATYLKPHQHHVQPLIDFTAHGWQQARDFAAPYLALVTPYVESATQDVRTTINEFFEEQEAVRVVATTVMLTLLSLIALSIVIEVLDFCFSQIGKLMGWGPKRYFGNMFFALIKLLPGGRAYINKKSAASEKQMAEMVLGKEKKGKTNIALPQQGMAESDLFKILTEWSADEGAIWKTGQVSGCVYHGKPEFQALVNRAYSMFSVDNPLHPDVFPYVRKMDAEVVSMVLSMFHADLSVAGGTTTSGGTESILLACKTYRDWALAEKGIYEPEIVAPETIHAAFMKAASYFNIKLVLVPVDPVTFRAKVSAMKRACNSNTIMIAASAPQFAQGVIDPITELAAFAKSRSIGMHVDSCLGGFLLPFMESIGRKVAPFDFRVPGVTSMSADPHKFGFTPKGVSCVLYADAKLRRYQYFVAPEWTGGIYASPTIAGSRPGGLLAGAWAAMMSIGQEGYQQYTKRIIDATKQVADGVRSIAGLKLCGEPDASVVCFASNDKAVDVYKVAEAMSNRHWNLNSLQNPSCVHLCLTNLHVDKADQFVADLKASVEQVRNNPSAFRDGSAAIYGMAASIPDKSIVDNLARSFVDTLYKTQV